MKISKKSLVGLAPVTYGYEFIIASTVDCQCLNLVSI